MTLRAMAAEGRTVIFISHKLHEVTAVADRVTVLRGGRSVATRRDGDGVDAQSLAALMVGREVEVARRRTGDRRDRRRPCSRSRASRAAGDRGVDGACDDVSLAVRAGEVLGVAGVAGNGQRELAEVVTGMRPLTAGAGARRRPRRCAAATRAQAIRAGVAHVPEDRLHTGVAPSLSIASNVVAQGVPRRPASRRAVPAAAADPPAGRRADPALRREGSRAGHARRGSSPAATCRRSCSPASSPASRRCSSPPRRPAVSTWARSRPCTPTSAQAADDGVAILLISEDLDEVLTLADRIAVMYEGAIVGEVDARTATVEQLGLLMAGVPGRRVSAAAGPDREAARAAALADGRRPARLARRRASR